MLSSVDCTLKYALDIETRSTEGAVRGPQYGQFPSIQPEKHSFEGCIEGFVLRDLCTETSVLLIIYFMEKAEFTNSIYIPICLVLSITLNK